MALRANVDDHSNSPVPGVNYFWQDAKKAPSYAWEKWFQLFEAAVLARLSISLYELTRDADEQNLRVVALVENLELEPASRKVTSLLYISIGKEGRKMLLDQIPANHHPANTSTTIDTTLQ